MIVLCIAALTFMIAAPSFAEIGERWRADRVASTVATVLRSARGYSLKYRDTVMVCGVRRLGVAQQACISDWSRGVIVFIDADRNRRYTDGDEKLDEFAFGMVNPGAVLCKNRVNVGAIGYIYNGTLNPSTLASVYFHSSTRETQFRRRIIVNMAGRVRVEKGGEITRDFPCTPSTQA